jgi:hypothetical protein
MTRLLIFALVGALSLAGGTGLAFGEDAGPKTPTKPQAKKPAPTPPKKQPPSKPPTQTNKPPSHRDVKVDVPKGGPQPTANKNPAKPGNGSKPGAGSYSLDDLNRDLKKANQEQWDGFKEELPVDAAMVATAASGGSLVAVGAAGIAAGGQQFVHGKYLQLKGQWDGLAATGKFIGSWFNNNSQSNSVPVKSGMK